VEGQGQLDGAEVGAEVPAAGVVDGSDHELPISWARSVSSSVDRPFRSAGEWICSSMAAKETVPRPTRGPDEGTPTLPEIAPEPEERPVSPRNGSGQDQVGGDGQWSLEGGRRSG